MYSTLPFVGSLAAFFGHAQAEFAVGFAISQSGIGEIVPNTGGDIYTNEEVGVSYPGGCLNNVQRFECVSEACLGEYFWEIKGKKTGDQYGFDWTGEGWDFSQNSEILGYCEKNTNEGCTDTGVNYSLGFFSRLLCTGSINSGFDN